MFKKPFSFQGRIRRIEYFLSGLVGGIVSSIIFTVGLGTSVAGVANDSGAGVGIGMIISLVALVGVWWFMLAQYAKRLHDLNKSAWFLLILLIPLVNFVFALYMLFADGTVGPNRYGDDPKNRMPYNPQA